MRETSLNPDSLSSAVNLSASCCNDLLASRAQGVGVIIHSFGVLGGDRESEDVPFKADLVGLLVQQGGLNGSWGDGIQNRHWDRRLREVGHRIEPLQLLHDVDEDEFHEYQKVEVPLSSWNRYSQYFSVEVSAWVSYGTLHSRSLFPQSRSKYFSAA
jgi:hypothetical protein